MNPPAAAGRPTPSVPLPRRARSPARNSPGSATPASPSRSRLGRDAGPLLAGPGTPYLSRAYAWSCNARPSPPPRPRSRRRCSCPSPSSSRRSRPAGPRRTRTAGRPARTLLLSVRLTTTFGWSLDQPQAVVVGEVDVRLVHQHRPGETPRPTWPTSAGRHERARGRVRVGQEDPRSPPSPPAPRPANAYPSAHGTRRPSARPAVGPAPGTASTSAPGSATVPARAGRTCGWRS